MMQMEAASPWRDLGRRWGSPVLRPQEGCSESMEIPAVSDEASDPPVCKRFCV